VLSGASAAKAQKIDQSRTPCNQKRLIGSLSKVIFGRPHLLNPRSGEPSRKVGDDGATIAAFWIMTLGAKLCDDRPT